jgi:High potential iron-sulfur protein
MPLNIARRDFIRNTLLGVAAIPAAAAMSRAARADDDFPTLKEDDITAKSIAYVADASKVDAKAFPQYRPGQDCSNCKLYASDKGATKGVCELVLGQYVLAKGWCKSWEPRPAATKP